MQKERGEDVTEGEACERRGRSLEKREARKQKGEWDPSSCLQVSSCNY